MLKLPKALNLTQKLHQFLHYSTSSIQPNPSFANYLVDSLGVSAQQSLSTSNHLAKLWRTRGVQRVSDFDFSENANSVVNFFKQHGFDQTHIKKLVSTNPRILVANVDKTLEPKFKVLQEMGFSGSTIVELILFNRSVLTHASESSVAPTIQALRQVLGSDDHVILVLKKIRWAWFGRIITALVPNVALLESYGFPIELIRKRIVQSPSPFLRSPESFRDIVTRVEEKLEISRDSRVFLQGIHVLGCLSDKNFESKCEVFKSFGWTESDIKALIKSYPMCLGLSVDRLNKSLKFLMKELGYEPAYLATHPALLSFSLENRIMPRHRVLLVLKEKGLIRRDYSLYTAVGFVESQFLKKFILPFEEVQELYTKETGLALKAATKSKN